MVTPTNNPLGYLGTDSTNPRDTFYRRRDPTTSDLRLYKLGDRWINTESASAFILVSKSNGLSLWEAIGGGSTQIASLTGNFGGAIFPVAGNVNVFGQSGIRLSGSGNTLMVNNLRDLSAFVVSPVPGEAEYSSVQAAINAAAPTGGVVIILPGQYFENIVLARSVCLLGLIEPIDVNNPQRVAIFGNVTCDPGSVFTSVENIFFSSLVALPTFSEGASSNLILSATNCVFFNFSGGDAIKVAMPAFGGATLNFYNCAIYSGNDAFVLGQNTNTYVTQSFIQPSMNAVNMTSISSLQMEYTNVGGPCTFSGNGAGTFQFCRFFGGPSSCFTQSALTTNCTVTTSTIQSNAGSTFFASGTGAFRVGNCALSGSATVVDPGLTSTVFPSI